MKTLKILGLVPQGGIPPDSLRGFQEKEIAQWRMEYDVLSTLKKMGHQTLVKEISSDLGVIRSAIGEWDPDITFNMLEDFHDVAVYDQHVVSYLELLKKPYTGCNPRGLMLSHDKPLSKKILSFHRIRVPDFAHFTIGQKIRRPKRLEFPLFVKSTIEEASLGIAQASLVHNDEQLKSRIEFIHEQIGTDAFAEEFIDGRELYVGVLGNQRLKTFPVWELLFKKMPDDVPRIATAKAKWDLAYQKKHGIVSERAQNLPDRVQKELHRLSRRIYRALSLSGYARIDFRLTQEGKIYVLEANPNPDLSQEEDFAKSAKEGGIRYETLLQKILNLGLHYRAEWKG